MKSFILVVRAGPLVGPKIRPLVLLPNALDSRNICRSTSSSRVGAFQYKREPASRTARSAPRCIPSERVVPLVRGMNAISSARDLGTIAGKTAMAEPVTTPTNRASSDLVNVIFGAQAELKGALDFSAALGFFTCRDWHEKKTRRRTNPASKIHPEFSTVGDVGQGWFCDCAVQIVQTNYMTGAFDEDTACFGSRTKNEVSSPGTAPESGETGGTRKTSCPRTEASRMPMQSKPSALTT